MQVESVFEGIRNNRVLIPARAVSRRRDLKIVRTAVKRGNFGLERGTVHANEVFPLPVRRCKRYLKNRSQAVLRGELSESQALNSAFVAGAPTDYLPPDRAQYGDLAGFHNQDVPAYMMRLQAEAILNFPFMRHVAKNYKPLPGYRLQRAIIRSILRASCWLSPEQVVLGHGTIKEIRLTETAFASDMGCFDLYKVLGEGYPIYHAEMTRRIPAYVNENMDELIENGASRIKSPVELLVWGKKRRFMGLYPVIEVPEEHLAADTPWYSQDQLARREICHRVFLDAKAELRKNPEKPVYVIDFGGGVGNLSELLLKDIYALPDSEAEIRQLMISRVRVIVRDIADRQLQGGIKRFAKMEQGSNGSGIGLSGITKNICFLKSDITKPMDAPDQLRDNGRTATEALCAKWPDFNISGCTVIGMSAYALGAIPAAFMEKAAEEISRSCLRFYAVDFSSPMWRPEAFLTDTGEWGRAYLRAMHGKSDGIRDAILHPHLKLMALSPGLASQYATWTGADGHSAGYTINSDNTLKPPNIQVVAEKMRRLCEKDIYYTSKVRLFTLLYMGRTVSGKIALAAVPGWIADYLLAE